MRGQRLSQGRCGCSMVTGVLLPSVNRLSCHALHTYLQPALSIPYSELSHMEYVDPLLQCKFFFPLIHLCPSQTVNQNYVKDKSCHCHSPAKTLSKCLPLTSGKESRAWLYIIWPMLTSKPCLSFPIPVHASHSFCSSPTPPRSFSHWPCFWARSSVLYTLSAQLKRWEASKGGNVLPAFIESNGTGLRKQSKVIRGPK